MFMWGRGGGYVCVYFICMCKNMKDRQQGADREKI